MNEIILIISIAIVIIFVTKYFFNYKQANVQKHAEDTQQKMAEVLAAVNETKQLQSENLEKFMTDMEAVKADVFTQFTKENMNQLQEKMVDIVEESIKLKNNVEAELLRNIVSKYDISDPIEMHHLETLLIKEGAKDLDFRQKNLIQSIAEDVAEEMKTKLEVIKKLEEAKEVSLKNAVQSEESKMRSEQVEAIKTATKDDKKENENEYVLALYEAAKSQREIAEIMNISRAKVKKIIDET